MLLFGGKQIKKCHTGKDKTMEDFTKVIGYIVAAGIIYFGWKSMFKDAREKGVGYLVAEIIVAIIIVAFF